MIQLPRLMVIILILYPIQWTSSIGQRVFHENYPHQEVSLLHSINANLFFGKRIIPINTLSGAMRKFEGHVKINPENNIMYSLISNKRTSSLKNKYSSVNGFVQVESPSTTIYSTPGDEQNSKIAFNKFTPELRVIKKPSSVSSSFFNLKVPAEIAFNKFTPEPNAVKKCSVNGSYCIKVDNYPRQEFLNIFGSSEFLPIDQNNIDIVKNENVDRQSRMMGKHRSFCDSREEIIFPEAGFTQNNEWLFIAQVDGKNDSLRQAIRVETCLHNANSNDVESNCRFNEYLPEGFSSVCVQKYTYRRMITVDNSKKVYYDQFLFPSCCTCMYKDNFD